MTYAAYVCVCVCVCVCRHHMCVGITCAYVVSASRVRRFGITCAYVVSAPRVRMSCRHHVCVLRVCVVSRVTWSSLAAVWTSRVLLSAKVAMAAQSRERPANVRVLAITIHLCCCAQGSRSLIRAKTDRQNCVRARRVGRQGSGADTCPSRHLRSRRRPCNTLPCAAAPT